MPSRSASRTTRRVLCPSRPPSGSTIPSGCPQLGQRNREIAKDMALDLGTFELADRHKVSAGRISQLRREFHTDWQRFHGELQ